MLKKTKENDELKSVKTELVNKSSKIKVESSDDDVDRADVNIDDDGQDKII